MNYLALADVRELFLRHAWTTALALYVTESAVVESISAGRGVYVTLGYQVVGVTSILIAFSYGYAGLDGGLRAVLGDRRLDAAGRVVALPAMRSGIGLVALTAAGPPMIDLRRLLQGSAAAWIFTGSVYVVSQGFSSSLLVWAVSATQGLGLVGGFAGKLLFDPLIESGVDWYAAFIVSSVAGTGLAVVIVWNRANRGGPVRAGVPMLALLRPYHGVLVNRQTWLCGIVAGLLFAPLTTGGMTGTLAFFEYDLHLGAGRAAIAMGLVAVGWLVGRPLVAFLAHRRGHRRTVVLAAACVMLAAVAQMTLWTDLASPLVDMFVIGVASASTMIPYTMFVEASASRGERRGMAVFKLLNFAVLTLTGVMFRAVFGPAWAGSDIPCGHLHEVGAFWMATILGAMVFAVFLRETERCEPATGPLNVQHAGGVLPARNELACPIASVAIASVAGDGHA